MESWVVDLLFPVWLRVFLAGASTSSFMSLRRDPGRGERRSVTGSAALRGVPTLGGINTLGGSTLGGGNHGGGPVDEITKVSGGVGLGVWRGGWQFCGVFPGYVLLHYLCPYFFRMVLMCSNLSRVYSLMRGDMGHF